MGADGVFLDTIGSILPQFHREIDRALRGIVFCADLVRTTIATLRRQHTVGTHGDDAFQFLRS
jgi:hypothetical protein